MPTSSPSIVLLDTNILLRLVVPNDPNHASTMAALRTMRRAGSVLYVCPQNMQEFRQTATRPADKNGYGWTSDAVRKAIERFELEFVMTAETPAIYPAWRHVTEATGAIGRANFDARIVAVAMSAGLNGVLTFEAGAFARYAAQAPGLVILHPKDV